MVPSPDTSGTGDGSPPPAILRVVTFGGAELADALGDGAPLAAAVAARRGQGPDIELRTALAGPLPELLATSSAWSSVLDGAHVVLRSVSPDVQRDHGDGTSAIRLGESFREDFARFVGLVKPSGATIVAVNGSTVDPSDRVFSYATAPITPPLVIHQYNLELIRLSMLDGISVLDADRVVSQEGGNENVAALFDYGAPVLRVILDELAMILEEYGWFDDRPILAQRGQRDKGVAA